MCYKSILTVQYLQQYVFSLSIKVFSPCSHNTTNDEAAGGELAGGEPVGGEPATTGDAQESGRAMGILL